MNEYEGSRYLEMKNHVIRDDISKEELLEEIDALKRERDDLKLMLKVVTTHSDGIEADLRNRTDELRNFVHVVSHDLKAPLRGIKQLVNWIEQDYGSCFDKEGHEMLELLQDRVIRMNDLIKRILYYFRMGRIAGENEELDLNILIDGVCSTLAVPEHIRIVIEERLPLITGNKLCLDHVFQNLLSNAITFMDKAEGLIAIDVKDEPAHWTLSVADNGPGIAPHELDNIFHIFHSSQNTDDQSGTGVGLSIVKRLVEAYGGEVWVESELGAGSTFFFTIPKKRSEP